MVRIGIIGCGSITRNRHAPEYSANPQAVIAGYYDRNRDRAEQLADSYGGKIYDSVEELLRSGDIDAVSVCTSNATHAAITIQALESGKHVLCEKPMAVTLEECAGMAEASERTGKYLMIAHNQRLTYSHAKAKEILQSGEMGRILSFSTVLAHPGPEHYSAAQGKHTWYLKQAHASLGAMGDLGIHKADLIRWLTGEEFTEVSSFSATRDKTDENGELAEVNDNAVCLLRSESGIIGTLAVSYSNYGDWDSRTVIYCANGVLICGGNPDSSVELVRRNNERILYKPEASPGGQARINSRVIDTFVDCIVNRKPPEISGREGMAAMKMVMGCLESARTGSAVRI
ncbi:putative dehydrogenase [Paenibacillus forsythiae]|uniref:Dehydrogenase n=1 Tax=Paenibacillus forsythiae TaxID=365616 RepID=A0ABU3H5X1_9BACL|nr:Gfo/Idh/MocA family oxidoreductase [Paenibacillus forsythiae]MDT3426217.1 putative dehydrogenase [Paenibacillus forsythiae]